MNNGLLITIRRSVGEIGGNCIEITNTNGERILLDVGLPLNIEQNGSELPKGLDLTKKIEGVLISHPHQDHYGLFTKLPIDWPIYCGKDAEGLIRLGSSIFGEAIFHKFRNWKSGVPFGIGAFKITPYLTDHSAFDAYMLLIEADGKKIFYTGDFRTHGRKSVLIDRMLAKLPKDIDALIMEGTNLGNEKPTKTEAALEDDFVELFQNTKGRVFVAWSAQNIDRTVSIFRACKRTGRTLVVDAYAAEVMKLLEPNYPNLPTIGWDGIKVVITSSLARMYNHKRQDNFIENLAKSGNAFGAAKLQTEYMNAVIMLRSGALQSDYAFKGVVPNSDDAWCWSQWIGYLNDPKSTKLKDWFNANNCPSTHIHTSGHASAKELSDFAKKISPKCIIPIHGENWHAQEDNEFPNILHCMNDEAVIIR